MKSSPRLELSEVTNSTDSCVSQITIAETKGGKLADSGVPGFTEDQLEEYISSGDIDPIFETSAGIDSHAEIYELNGRFVLQWRAAEGTESGMEVLDTESLDEARAIAESQASDLASYTNTDFDEYLDLGNLVGFNSPDRFYPLPEGYRPIYSYVLESDYYRDEVAEIVLYSKNSESHNSNDSVFDEGVLAFSKAQGLVVGEFESLEEVKATVIEEPPGFMLEFRDLTDSEE